MTKRELAQLASIVHKRYQLLKRDLVPWLDIMPDPWMPRLVYLRDCVEHELQQVRGAYEWQTMALCYSAVGVNVVFKRSK